MNKVIVIWNDMWNYTANVNGWIILYKEEAENWFKNIKTIEDSFPILVGADADIEYENGEAFLATLRMKDISETEITTLTNVFGSDKHNDDFYVNFWEFFEDDDDDDDDFGEEFKEESSEEETD